MEGVQHPSCVFWYAIQSDLARPQLVLNSMNRTFKEAHQDVPDVHKAQDVVHVCRLPVLPIALGAGLCGNHRGRQDAGARQDLRQPACFSRPSKS